MYSTTNHIITQQIIKVMCLVRDGIHTHFAVFIGMVLISILTCHLPYRPAWHHQEKQKLFKSDNTDLYPQYFFMAHRMIIKSGILQKYPACRTQDAD